MNFQNLSLAALAAFSMGSSAQAQAPAATPVPGAAPTPAVPKGGGPLPAVMLADKSLPTHTIYRPEDLSKVEGKLPIVIWGNGACANSGNSFQPFLTEIASYGYFVVAVGPIDLRTPDQRPRPTVGADGRRILPPPETKSSQLIDGLNWAVAEAARTGGPYAGKLDTGKVAIMGQSCGGVQALEASADKRVTATVIWNSGMPVGGTDMAGGRPLTKADLKRLHAPIAYIVGDDSDQAKPNAMDDFDKLSLPVFFGSEHGVPHGGTYRQPNGGEFAGVGVALLNWRLKDDAQAAKMFVGPDCGLCVNPRWMVRQKNLR